MKIFGKILCIFSVIWLTYLAVQWTVLLAHLLGVESLWLGRIYRVCFVHKQAALRPSIAIFIGGVTGLIGSLLVSWAQQPVAKTESEA